MRITVNDFRCKMIFNIYIYIYILWNVKGESRILFSIITKGY